MKSGTRVAPEVDVLILSFPMHSAWEFLQAPLFRSMEPLSHFEGILVCLQATLGDMALVLVAFWTTCLVTGTRHWPVLDRHDRISKHRIPRPLDLCRVHAAFAIAWNRTCPVGAVDRRADDRLLVHAQTVIRSERLIAVLWSALGSSIRALPSHDG